MGQEEAFRSAVGQLNEDVEGKLDRMELEPLREYIGMTIIMCCGEGEGVEEMEDRKEGEEVEGRVKEYEFSCHVCVIKWDCVSSYTSQNQIILTCTLSR